MERELKFGVDEKRTAIDVFTLWLPRIALVAAFVLIGYSKFSDDPRSMWVQLFDKIGFGQWFRYLAGVMQVGGALLMLMRRTITLGAAMLACTMAGAIIVDIVVQHAIGYAFVPLTLLGVITVIWYAGRHGVAAERP